MQHESPLRDPLILGNKSYSDITADIARPIEGKANKYWYLVFTIAAATFLWGFGCLAYTVGTGFVWYINTVCTG